MRLDAVIPALHQDDFSTVRLHRTRSKSIMSDPKKDERESKTYQEDDGKWVTEDYGRPREATSEEIEDKLQEYKDAQKGANNQD